MFELLDLPYLVYFLSPWLIFDPLYHMLDSHLHFYYVEILYLYPFCINISYFPFWSAIYFLIVSAETLPTVDINLPTDQREPHLP